MCSFNDRQFLIIKIWLLCKKTEGVCLGLFEGISQEFAWTD
jgi:hypothetical protein